MSDPALLRGLFDEAGDSAGVPLSPFQVGQLVAYWSLLSRWNSTVKLTSLPLAQPTAEAVRRLIWEPLFASRLSFGAPAAWLDLGSGCGSPAIPMKVVRPAIPLCLVESRSRKVAFLREAIRAAGLATAEVIQARIEALSNTVRAGSIGLVTMRAVRLTPGIAKSICHLLSADGSLILFGCPDRTLLGKAFTETSYDSGITLLTRRIG